MRFEDEHSDEYERESLMNVAAGRVGFDSLELDAPYPVRRLEEASGHCARAGSQP